METGSPAEAFEYSHRKKLEYSRRKKISPQKFLRVTICQAGTLPIITR
jgi:aminopeptidase C